MINVGKFTRYGIGSLAKTIKVAGLQGEPLPVIHGVITYNPYKWHYKWVTVVIMGVITLLISGTLNSGPSSFHRIFV